MALLGCTSYCLRGVRLGRVNSFDAFAVYVELVVGSMLGKIWGNRST